MAMGQMMLENDGATHYYKRMKTIGKTQEIVPKMKEMRFCLIF